MKRIRVFGGQGVAVIGGRGVPCTFSLVLTYRRGSEFVEASLLLPFELFLHFCIPLPTHIPISLT